MAEGMTTDELARIIQGEFQNVHTEFQNVHTEFQNVHGEIRELKEEIAELHTTVARIDLRTQNQVDSVYEDTGVLKKDMKTAKLDIVAIKAHVGMEA